MNGTVAAEGRCAFAATDGRRCVMLQWHKAPRKEQGYYVTYGDLGDAHLLEGGEPCKWGDGPKVVTGEVTREGASSGEQPPEPADAPDRAADLQARLDGIVGTSPVTAEWRPLAEMPEVAAALAQAKTEKRADQ